MLVGENLFLLLRDRSQIVRHEQRRRPDRPDGHLRLHLLVGEAIVADDDHIRIEPLARSVNLHVGVLVFGEEVDDREHAGPGEHDVVVVTPDVAGIGDLIKVQVLVLDQVGWPGARVDDWSTCFVKCISERRVGALVFGGVRIASVHLSEDRH